MFLSNLSNHCKEQVSSLVLKNLASELKCKIKKDKEKTRRFTTTRKIFGQPIQAGVLVDVTLTNNTIVQVPSFVHQACERILLNVTTEGIFRRGGSTIRQKAIREELEKGCGVKKEHHVLDIASLLKTFFRELPEQLIPSGNIQETLIRCLLCSDDYQKCESLMMAVLMLNPICLSTLAYFMQFLGEIAANSDTNKMSFSNLAVILTPGIMPVKEGSHQNRLSSHFKVLELLLENADKIGIVPQRLLNQVQMTTPSPAAVRARVAANPSTPGVLVSNLSVGPLVEDKKKKRRRSASLTRMFGGIRKYIKGSQSTESLDKETDDSAPATPCISKSTKKRAIESANTFSAKKKKDILSQMPQHDLLPRTPRNKEIKKTRLSLGGKKSASRETLKATEPTGVSERRWSISRSWKSGRSSKKENEASPVASSRNTRSSLKLETPEKMEVEIANVSEKVADELEEYVKISKSEYESFKERVIAIETRISQEFHTVKLNTIKGEQENSADESLLVSGPEKVQNKYRVLMNSDAVDGSEDLLAKHMSRDLKIRRSSDQKVVRSPSARKIGSIRRKSQDKVQRNHSWHFSATTLGNSQPTAFINKSSDKMPIPEPNITHASFYPKSSLKRGRPNTLQTGLQTNQRKTTTEATVPETWTNATDFFQGMEPTETIVECKETVEEIFKTPSKPVRPTIKSSMTPMNPPDIPPRRTPGGVHSPMMSKTPMRTVELPTINRMLTPSAMDQQCNGRASIARIRSQQAGSVLQKAKLFDGMTKETKLAIVKPNLGSQPPPIIKAPVHRQVELVRRGLLGKRSPTKTKSPPNGVNRRHQLRPSQSPLANKRNDSENRLKQKLGLLSKNLEEVAASPTKKLPQMRKPLMAKNSSPRLIKTPDIKRKPELRSSPRLNGSSKGRLFH